MKVISKWHSEGCTRAPRHVLLTKSLTDSIIHGRNSWLIELQARGEPFRDLGQMKKIGASDEVIVTLYCRHEQTGGAPKKDFY